MKNLIRNIYPGGNTPYGFYSYYNHILPQRKAEKIFCIKGGPGAGKSTLMKSIGKYFEDMGEDIDYMWCSSDPQSLDGLVIKKKGVALIDGTSPHITDPKNPGAVDKILNMGEFWDEGMLSESRDEIIACNESIGTRFRMAYVYLNTAGIQYEMMAELSEDLLGKSGVADITRQLDMKINGILTLKRAESKIMKETALGGTCVTGEEKRYFASAITPMGLRSNLTSILGNIDRIIKINMPIGFNCGKILEAAAGRFINAGFDVEKYYCPMNPSGKLEHIVVPDGKFAIVSSNPYHSLELPEDNKKNTVINIVPDRNVDRLIYDVFTDLQEDSGRNIEKAVGCLELAKSYHDKLEKYYIEAMDFSDMENFKEEIITEIENI